MAYFKLIKMEGITMKAYFRNAIILLVVISLSITTVSTAIAKTSSESISATYKDIKISIDGNDIILKDATGAYVYPFVYGGTTYLPVRAIGEALGMDVEWDAGASTVRLTFEIQSVGDAGTPQSRNILNPTSMQTALNKDNKYILMPKIAYTTPASENRLGDTPMFVRGKMIERLDGIVAGADAIKVQTSDGIVFIYCSSASGTQYGKLNPGWDALNTDTEYYLYYNYNGYSDVLDGAAGMYIGAEQIKQNVTGSESPPSRIAVENITVSYKDISILLNGQKITPKDANGTVVEPFVYKGTTFLPLRAIGQALGMSVDWDASTNTAILKSSSAPAASQDSTLTYYEEFPEVPDFGAIVGLEPINSGWTSGTYNVTYDSINITQSNMRTYGEALTSAGFSTIEGTNTNSEELYLKRGNVRLLTTVYSSHNIIALTMGYVATGTEAPEKDPSIENAPTISLAEFNSIQIGMSYSEVYQLIGGIGTLLSEFSVADISSKIYSWDGEGAIGSNALVTFQNGAVIGKAQYGLE
jgi:hypothetical protein